MKVLLIDNYDICQTLSITWKNGRGGWWFVTTKIYLRSRLLTHWYLVGPGLPKEVVTHGRYCNMATSPSLAFASVPALAETQERSFTTEIA